VQISAATPEVVVVTYKRQQTMLERQRRLNFLLEILFQATTMCDNSIADTPHFVPECLAATVIDTLFKFVSFVCPSHHFLRKKII